MRRPVVQMDSLPLTRYVLFPGPQKLGTGGTRSFFGADRAGTVSEQNPARSVHGSASSLSLSTDLPEHPTDHGTERFTKARCRS